MAMERAEVDSTPLFTALPLNDEDGAKADAEAASAERMNATVFMVFDYVLDLYDRRNGKVMIIWKKIQLL